MYYHPMISSLFPYTTLFRSVCSAVINQVDRTTDSRDVSRWLRQQFDSEGDGLVRVLNTTIPDLAAYNKAAGLSLPVHRYPHRSRGRAPSPRETLLELAYELQPNLIGIEAKGEIGRASC